MSDKVPTDTILRCPVGSTIHGLHLEGSDDRDEMGICVENIQDAVGFNPTEHVIFRSAAEREHKHDAKSQPGDLDLTIYSLRKYLRLALQGNPTVLTLLFVPPKLWVSGDSRGRQLQELAPSIISRQAGKRYLGYLQAQRQRMLGEKGGLDVHRKELEEKFGYDTKYAMHMLRLGYQGIELLRTGKITFPMPEYERKHILSVRKGESTRQEVLTECGQLEVELQDLLDHSPLPEHPAIDKVERWMLSVYWESWKCDKHDTMIRSQIKRATNLID